MKHILIMEDNALLAHEWRDTFELNGHKVTLTYNGADAVRQLDEIKFDLVITDLFVPGKQGGLHVVGKILRMRRGAPPIIAVTGEKRLTERDGDTNYFLRQVEQLGVSQTLEKPFPAAELLLIADKFWRQR
jgi:CheY-like chemotaxis protein